ncbi:hypothetical protein C0J52_26183 [Blattella germanica]|nr:hypothetical protein C0J52_26183 [Blattella germanica]
MINYDKERGVAVHSDKSSSVLVIAEAKKTDSGNYSSGAFRVDYSVRLDTKLSGLREKKTLAPMKCMTEVIRGETTSLQLLIPKTQRRMSTKFKMLSRSMYKIVEFCKLQKYICEMA